MDLQIYYQKSSHKELVIILENATEYTLECIMIVKDIFLSRDIDASTLEKLVYSVLKDKIQKIFENFDFTGEFIVPHKSPFLSEEEMKELYKSELDLYMNRNGNRNINETYDYWID